MIVKVCGITTLEDALDAVDAGATALGFNFYPRSKRYIEPSVAAGIAAKLPPAIWRVGVFVNEDGAAIAREIGLDIVQLHGEASAPSGLRTWLARSADESFRLESLNPAAAEAFLIDTPAGAEHGGTGRVFDWSLVAGARVRLILAGGLDASNVRAAIESVHPWGVDACSRLEKEPGRKDPAKVRAFVKAALS